MSSFTQIECMLMELMQKNFYIREAQAMMEYQHGRTHNDIYALLEKMKVERNLLKKRIDDAQYPED